MIRREDMSKEEWDAIQAAEVRAGMDPVHLSVLRAIIAGRLAWSGEGELMVHLGCDPEDLRPVLAELVSLKLAVEWDLGGEPQFTLAKYGAWVMQVQILERISINGEELEEDPYWTELGRIPRLLHLPKRRHETRWPWMDEIEDPNADQPIDAVLLDEMSGDPILLQGRTIKIDPRLGKKKAKGKAKAGKAKPKRRAG